MTTKNEIKQIKNSSNIKNNIDVNYAWKNFLNRMIDEKWFCQNRMTY